MSTATEQAPVADHTNGDRTPQPSRRFKISGDQVNHATANLPDEQRAAIRGLHAYMVERDILPAEIAPFLKKENGDSYSPDSVYQLMTGRRESGIDNMADSIQRFLKLESERATITRAPFVKTKLVNKIWKLCQAALTYQKVCFLIGATHTGKSTALQEYAREHNHGETIYVEMPAGGNLSDFLVALCEALRISPFLPMREARRRVKRAFDSRMLLIVDQAHEPFQNERSEKLPMVMLFIMEIFNSAKCGIVFSGTDVLRGGFEGRHKKILRQLSMRSLVWLRLPDAPTAPNLNDFASAYGLAPAAGSALAVQTAVIADHGLGRWCTVLQAASRMASKIKRAVSWTQVLNAHAALAAMETNGGEE